MLIISSTNAAGAKCINTTTQLDHLQKTSKLKTPVQSKVNYWRDNINNLLDDGLVIFLYNNNYY